MNSGIDVYKKWVFCHLEGTCQIHSKMLVTLAKHDDAESRLRLGTILYTVCESLRAISILYSPIMPKSMSALWSDIGAAESGISKSLAEVATWGQLKPGVKITKSESMFPRIEEPETI